LCKTSLDVTIPTVIKTVVQSSFGPDTIIFKTTADANTVGTHNIGIAWKSTWGKTISTKNLKMEINDLNCEDNFKASNKSGLTASLVDKAKIENIDLPTAFTVTSSNTKCTNIKYALAW